MKYLSFKLSSQLLLLISFNILTLNAITLSDEVQTCDLFLFAISSKGELKAQSNDIFGSCTISANSLSDGEDLTCYERSEANTSSLIKCTCDPSIYNCSYNNTCTIIKDANKSNYTHQFLTTTSDLTTTTIETNINIYLTELQYGNYEFSADNQQIYFNPANTYDNQDTNVMLLGDITNTNNNQVMHFSDGDYYIKSLASTGSLTLDVEGDVRIFIDGNLSVNSIDLTTTTDSILFLFVDGDVNLENFGGGNEDLSMYLYTTGNILIEPNTNSFAWLGGIIGEGNFTITGNDAPFVFDSAGADSIGVGLCGSSDGTYVTGFLDAWEQSITNRNIKTKIAGQNFDLSIAHLDSTNTTIEVFPILVKYRLYDYETNTSITNYDYVDLSSSAKINKYFNNIDKSYQDVRVNFRFCQDENGTIAQYDLCSAGVSGYNFNDSFSSSDNFAIRPNKLSITSISQELVSASDQEFSVRAQNYDTTASTGYSISDADYYLDIDTIKYLPNNTIDNTLSGNANITTYDFTNGYSNNLSISFDDVAKVKLIIEDRHWADVDSDDTPAECSATGRYICGDTNATFIPSHFDISAVQLYNDSNASFTYLSNDLNISARIQLTITAKNALNEITQNFDSASWENNVNINMSVSTVETPTLIANNINNTKLGFLNGIATIAWNETDSSKDLTFNFSRATSTALNPFRVLGSEVTLDASSVYSTKTVNSTAATASSQATFIFGKTNATRHRFEDSTGIVFIYYEAYCDGTGCDKSLLPNGDASTSTDDPRWFKNTLHDSRFSSSKFTGHIGTISQKYLTKTTLGTRTDSNLGRTTQIVNYTGSTYPYKVTMQNQAPSWLIYNKYKAGADKNEFEIEFNKSTGVSWAGKSNTNSSTVDTGSKKTNRRTMW